MDFLKAEPVNMLRWLVSVAVFVLLRPKVPKKEKRRKKNINTGQYSLSKFNVRHNSEWKSKAVNKLTYMHAAVHYIHQQ